MANLIGLVAPSGTGKSTSLFPNQELGIKGLNPKETIIINVADKPLPFRGANKIYDRNKKVSEGGNYANLKEPLQITSLLQYVDQNRSDVKNVVIDDFGYAMSFDVMLKVEESGFNKWTKLGSAMFQAINAARTMRPDLNVICIFHQEKGEDGRNKIKTSGKLIDNTIYLDGLFTVILFAEVIQDFKTGKVEYKFRTNTNGDSTCKSPVGMFPDVLIPNDMGYVVEQVNKYYEGE